MKHLKKVLIIVMSALLLSLLVVGTSAAFPDQDKIENETAVNMCTSLNIIRGRDDGKFDPLGTTTRAEMAKMICIILNKGNEPIWGTKAIPSYRDTKGHWAEPYIEYCTDLGIVAGMGDGTFNPNGKVTGTQAAKMLLVALGYDAAHEGFSGISWSFKINMVANQKDLYDKLKIDPNAPLNRDDAAQMIWNALSATMVKYTYGLTAVNGVLQSSKVAGEYSDQRTLLSAQYSAVGFEGQMSKFSYNETKREWTYEIVAPSATPATMTFTSKQNYTDLYGRHVHVVYKWNGTEVTKVYGIFAEGSSVLFRGVVKDIVIKSSSIQYRGFSYTLDNGTPAQTKAYAFCYDTAFSFSQGTPLNSLGELQKTYSFSAIDDDGDGKVDFLMTNPYTVAKVTYIGPDTITAGAPYLLKDCEVYDGIAKDKYVKITANTNTATGKTRLDAADKMISGTVTKVRGSDYSIDGEVYALAYGVSMSVGDTVKNAVVVNGFIFDAKVFHLGIQDYALVLDAIASNSNGLYGDQAKLLLSDGTKRIVNTDQAYPALKGKLVTYSIGRDDVYELKAADYQTAVGTCFDKAISAGNDEITSDSHSNQVKFIDHCMIADDAVIFVRVGDGSPEKPFGYQVITGANLQRLNKEGLSLLGAFANEYSSSGFDMVKLAYISTVEPLSFADMQYGYAVADYAVVKNRYNETVYEYTLWDGKSEVTVLARYGLQTAVHQGDVVAYTLDSDGAVHQIQVYATKGLSPAPEVASITAYDGSYLQLNGSATTYQIHKDRTKILYADNENGKGVETGIIQLADQGIGGIYIPNVLVLTSGSNVDLIVYDVTNRIIPSE